jgi:serine/threonine protein phosphatase 1
MHKGRRFVIGDIHGCFRTFKYLVEEELHLTSSDSLFLLGDLIDRGPGSKAVIDYVRELSNDMVVRPVLGNHEFMMLQSLDDEDYFRLWTSNGCAMTLLSFGVAMSQVDNWKSVSIIPEDYMDFIRKWPLYEKTDDFLFVHAGVDASGKDPLGDAETVLWTRNEEVPLDFLQGRKLIHGHTPVPLSLIQERLKNPETKIFNLDGGCVYATFPGLGFLVALDLDQMILHSVRNME